MAVTVINTNKTKEPTQKQFYEAIVKRMNGEPTEISEGAIAKFAEKKIEQLTAKSSKTNGKKNVEQEAFMDIIRDVLSENENAQGMTNAQILADERIKSFPWADDKTPTSASRLTYYLTYMGEPDEKHPNALGDIKRVVVKKTPYFSLV